MAAPARPADTGPPPGFTRTDAAIEEAAARHEHRPSAGDAELKMFQDIRRNLGEYLANLRNGYLQ